MKNKYWWQVRQGAQFQLTSRFVGILMGILAVVNLAFITSSLFSVYDYLSGQANEIIDTLEELPSKTSEWEDLANAMIAKSDDDAIRFILASGPTYYSAGGKEIFTDLANGRALPIFKGIIIAEDEVYYYRRYQQEDRQVELAIHGNTVIEMLGRLILISIFLNLLAIVIGSGIIYFFVGKWSKSLQQMSSEMKEIETMNDQKKLLSVPETPLEMHQTALSFNQLLQSQRQAITRESQFVTDASHELRTPVSAIRGHIQLIKRRGTEHPEVIAPSITFIDQESRRLETLTHQLLQLGRESNRSSERVNLSLLLEAEIQKFMQVTQQTVTMNIASEVYLWANELDFQQICQNLFENARKYSRSTDHIHIELQSVGDNICFEVQDTGIGIPDELKPRIFERFFRVDTSRSSRIEGSGIGLALVKSIVEKYQGTIQVKDNQPQGSIFSIWLPQDEEIFM